MAVTRLRLTRDQILGCRRRVSALDKRLPWGRTSLRQAAWAGLQDSMPRAAVLSIHARVEGALPDSWDDQSLVQVWGPRFSAYVVSAEDRAIFTVGRTPDSSAARQRAEDLATRLAELLGDATMTYREAGLALGEHPNRLRYATTTGTILIRWEGSRSPTIRSVPPPEVTPEEAREELVRRYLHVFGPATAEAFGDWAGVKANSAASRFESLESELSAVQTPIGEGWILSSDEEVFRASIPQPAPVRLLPSGDTFFLLQGKQRDLVVPSSEQRSLLWPSRVWPGAVLVNGEVAGIWRRSGNEFRIEAWHHLDRRIRAAIEEEAASLPLADLEDSHAVTWVE